MDSRFPRLWLLLLGLQPSGYRAAATADENDVRSAMASRRALGAARANAGQADVAGHRQRSDACRNALFRDQSPLAKLEFRARAPRAARRLCATRLQRQAARQQKQA